MHIRATAITMVHGDWETQPSFAKKWNLDAKLLAGKAWVIKTNDFTVENNCLYTNVAKVLLGIILQKDDLHYCILLRPGASIQIKFLSDFLVNEARGTKATVLRFKKKRKFVPDPDSEC